MTVKEMNTNALELLSTGYNQSRLLADFILIDHDLQIEAEALGCQLKWIDENQPALSSHPLINCISPFKLKIPDSQDGRIKQVISEIRRVSRNHPEKDPYTNITGPFSLALQLMGSDFFYQMHNNPGYVEKVLTFTSAVGEAMATMYIEAGCTGIRIVDPLAEKLDTVRFEKFVTPFIQPLIDYIHDQGYFCSVLFSEEVSSMSAV